MQAPQDFIDKLHTQSDGELRIRWSDGRGEWHIEQRVGRAVLEPSPVNRFDDEHIRARDGYVFVLAVRTGDRMPCPDCGIELKVPLLHFAEVKCDYCRLNGRDGRFPAGFFPLSDALLIHLRRLDPKRTWRADVKTQLDQRNKLMMASKEREYGNHIESVTKDYYNDMVGIGQWGYNSSAHPKGH